MLQYINLKPDYKEALEESRQRIVQLLKSSPKVNALPEDLLVSLRDFLSKDRRPQVFLLVDETSDKNCWAYQSVYSVWFRPKCFATPRDTPRLTAVLFHELIHVAHGLELDAEYYENLFFDRPEATPPTCGDYREFELNKGEGYWLYWKPREEDTRSQMSHRNVRAFMREVHAKAPVTLWRQSVEGLLPRGDVSPGRARATEANQ